MKKLFLIAFVSVLSLNLINAQETRFGVTAGYLNVSEKVKFSGESVSVSESGFYGGVFVEIPAGDQLYIQPELLYASVDEISFLQVPIMAKYYVADQFSLQGGPQFNFYLEDTGDDYTALGIGLGLGAGYDITEDFLVQLRYTFQINNSYTGDGDYEDRFNFFGVGLGYRF